MLSIRQAIRLKKVSRCQLPPHLVWIFKRLTERMQYAKRRCEAPSCPGYKTYGARGIKFQFKDVKTSVLWVLENLSHPSYDGLEIDRIDNDGHYEPGNLQLSTRQVNANNRITTAWVTMRSGIKLAREDFRRRYPECGYGPDQIRLLVRQGLTGEQIIQRYKTSYRKKPRSMTL